MASTGTTAVFVHEEVQRKIENLALPSKYQSISKGLRNMGAYAAVR